MRQRSRTLDNLETPHENGEFEIPASLRQVLDDVGQPELVFPYNFFQPAHVRNMSEGVADSPSKG